MKKNKKKFNYLIYAIHNDDYFMDSEDFTCSTPIESEISEADENDEDNDIDSIFEIFNLLKEDYKGEHGAPDKRDAPLWDLTANGVYPNDVYSSYGPEHYGSRDGEDSLIWNTIRRAKGRPNYRCKIYRAVPYEPTIIEKIEKLKEEEYYVKRYILRTGKLPKITDKYRFTNSSQYYNFIDTELEKLEKMLKLGNHNNDNIKYKINDGDWVTLSLKYARDHGKESLNNNYKIISKTVLAKHLYTDGNSILEWGYNP